MAEAGDRAAAGDGAPGGAAAAGARGRDRPYIVVVDDEPAVLAAVARDLRRHYGGRYRLLRAESGEEAVREIEAARLRNDTVALLLVDQRMPGLSGLETLEAARAHFPEAKRVLLTAYADTDASIRAINETRLDYYLLKPWDPPEERLFPVLDDLLDDWQASYRPRFDGLSVIGHRWSAAAHTVKDFLARNLVPYRWLDLERDGAAAELLALAGARPEDVPVVLLPDGRALVRPDPTAIATAIGLKTRADLPFYDLVIVGAGPAGLAAGVYGASEGLKTLLVECEAPGGQAGMSSSIENYLGFPVGLSGGDLARRAVTQARRFGAELLTPARAVGVRAEAGYRFVRLEDGSEVGCRALLVATGVSYRRLEVPGAERLAGAGIYYGAAITEALSAQDARVFVVGAGNSAGQAALYLARFAERVTMLIRGSSLAASMSQYLIDQVEAHERVDVLRRVEVEEVEGERGLEAITVRHLDGGSRERLEGDAVFVFIGAAPRTDWLDGTLACDPRGFILTGQDASPAKRGGATWDVERDPFWLECSVPGVFAAGDVRHRSVKRVASAVGEGAMAVQFVHQHLAGG